MKFIFDFDEVLLHTGKHYTEHAFQLLEKGGIPNNLVQEYYTKERLNLFSMKKLVQHFSLPEKLYEEIMSEISKYKNDKLLEIIQKLEKSNCFVLTFGEDEYQLDKIQRTGVGNLFSKIFVVQGSKKETIEKICTTYKNETVLFVDDKAKHFEDLDFEKYPNLKTILYDEQGLEKIKSILSQSLV